MTTIQATRPFPLIPWHLPRALACAGLAAAFFVTPQLAQAQLGSNWVQYSPVKKIHFGVAGDLKIYNHSSYQSEGSPRIAGNPISSDYTYDSTTDTEKFRRNNTDSNRAEIRLWNDYSTGERQFQGYVKFVTEIDYQIIMQIFGSNSGATLALTHGSTSAGGSIYLTSTGGNIWGIKTIATGCYGIEKRLNVIHSQDKYIQWYVNGSLKCQQGDTEVGVTNYHKYGCYGPFGIPTTIQWRQVRSYRDGTTPKVALYEATSYGGAKAEFACGSFTKASLLSAGMADDRASSIKVPAGYEVTLYPEDDYAGIPTIRTADDYNFVHSGFNDRVSSMKVTTTNK